KFPRDAATPPSPPTDQHLFSQHDLADILEPDRSLVTAHSQGWGNPRDNLTLRKGSNDGSTPALGSIDVQQEQRKNGEGVQELPLLVDDTETIRIAVGSEPDVTSRCHDSSCQRLQLRHHRLRVYTAKQRVKFSA